jgi:hypothetical protein
MKRTSILSVASALGLALAHLPAIASDAAFAKLGECMKMKAATPEQQACLKAVQSLRAAAPARAKSVAAPPPAVPKPKSTAGSTTPPKVIEPPPEFKAAAATVHLNGVPATKGSGVVGVGGGIVVGDIKGLDLETAMMAIQSQRANLLEGQLKTQMEGLQQRNDEIGKLNTLLGDLKAKRPGGTDPDKWGNLGANTADGRAMYARLQKAGITIPASVDEPGTGIYDAQQKTFDTWAEQLKGKIDSLNSSQQMDMLRMQSLTNKRNEAFDLMTNFIKKMADSRSSVLGNMR